MNQRPYVTLNIAMTIDGKTDTISRKGAMISSTLDMERVDRLRAESDAVMVGGRTLQGDDPRLTVKSEVLRAERLSRGLEENPIKVGVVTQATLPINSRFITTGPARKVIFTTTQTDASQVARLRQHGVQVSLTEGGRVDLVNAMKELKQGGVGRLLVEGGGTLNEELLKRGLVDEIRVYIAPLIFGGENAPTFVSGVGLERQNAIPLRLVDVHRSNGGLILRYLVGKTESQTNKNQGV
ncbi:MAG: 2,5-diamino-6-(ribosylamino)-4(3H)-pyrimidinone 5'-phosphate reductase [Anaerolineales bacterium]|nr:2,5-diamino-6-(ribosylamino)-4(3H)-pyrimidinone 5'-phosphate reductase [Anaerolineales bacterium]